jgi:hypothetical protein
MFIIIPIENTFTKTNLLRKGLDQKETFWKKV